MKIPYAKSMLFVVGASLLGYGIGYPLQVIGVAVIMIVMIYAVNDYFKEGKDENLRNV